MIVMISYNLSLLYKVAELAIPMGTTDDYQKNKIGTTDRWCQWSRLFYDCDANGLKKLVKLNDNIVKIA